MLLAQGFIRWKYKGKCLRNSGLSKRGGLTKYSTACIILFSIKADKCPSSTSHFFTCCLSFLFCKLKTGFTRKMSVLGFVLINSVSFNFFGVFMLLSTFVLLSCVKEALSADSSMVVAAL